MSARIFAAVLLFATPAAAGTVELPIVNGDTEAGHPAVASLGVQIQNSAISACTGTLITPRMVLTAGHCGAGYPLDLVVRIGQAMFGETAAGAETVVGFAELFQHPDYTGIGPNPGDLPANDVSVLLLEEDVVGIRPMPFRAAEITTEFEGIEGLSVGFGATGPGGDGTGTKRSAEVVFSTVYEQFIYAQNRDHEDGGGICGGDSGGPMMFQDDDADWIIWGVHSWGDQDCAIRSGSTRTDMFAEWILDQVEAAHGSRDICEVNDWYDDGTCDDCVEADPDCGPVEGDDDDDDDDDDDEMDDDDASDGDTDDPAGCTGCGASMVPAEGGSALLALLSAVAVLFGRARGSRGSTPSSWASARDRRAAGPRASSVQGSGRACPPRR